MLIVSFLIRSVAVGSPPTALAVDAASRLSFHMIFFQVLLFVIAIKVFADILTPRKVRNGMIMLVSISMLCFATYQFSRYEIRSSLKYLLGKMSFSTLYESDGSEYGLMVQNIAGEDNKVLMTNVCRACSGIPKSKIQSGAMSDFVEDFDVVYYGRPNEAKNVLKRVNINHIWFDTNKQLVPIAYAPLFHPDNIKAYFKISWHSDGKYLLTWSEGIEVDDEIMNEFIKKYMDRIEKDRDPSNTGTDMYMLYNRVKELLESDRFKYY